MTKDDPVPESRPSTSGTKPRVVGPTFAEPEEAVVDLSREIVKAVPRATGEHVTCRRVSGDHYRCNWWRAESSGGGGQAMNGLVVTTHRVSRSRFLHVTRTGQNLKIAADPPL